jgi:hypothetical protein
MRRVTVGKTIVAYPGKTEYVRVFDNESNSASVVAFAHLSGLAAHIRVSESRCAEVVGIKNDVPDLLWVSEHDVLECTRLSREELRELARLIRQK